MRRSAVEFDRSVPVLIVRIGRYPLHHGTVGAIRSLGRFGVPVYAITEDRFTPAALSRYLAGCFVWPTTGAERVDELAAGLARVARDLGRPAIAIATDDEAAVLLGEFGPATDSLILPGIEPSLPRTLASKRELYKLCRRIGVPTPEALFPSSTDEVLELARDVRFPIVVKNVDPYTRLRDPAVGSTTVVHTADELAARVEAWPDPPNVLLQEYIPVEHAEDWIFHMYCDQTSTCVAAFTGIKIRSWPPRGGVTAYARAVENAALAEVSSWLCREIGYRGIGDLDWRLDRRDGRYKLVDFNPRVGAQFRLFQTQAGIDVVRALHLDLTGRPVPRGRQVDGRRFVVEHLCAASLLSPRARSAQVPALPPRVAKPEFGWLCLDDPLPSLSLATRFTATALGRLTNRRRPTTPPGPHSPFRADMSADGAAPSHVADKRRTSAMRGAIPERLR